MSNDRKRMVVTGIGLVVIVMALLFGSAGMTAYAAQSALPGDTLYGVKTSLEQTRISMARDASVRAELYLEFAENRLEEISRLIADKRYKDISDATKDFEMYANQAIAELEVVAQGDPQQAAVLTGRISEALSRYSRTLTSMLASVPEEVRAQLSQVIEAAQPQGTPAVQATEVEFEGVVENIVTGGDFVKVHAMINGDGDLVAREIERADREDDANSNDDDDDDNSNSNSNDDDNLNSNDDDDNANSNSNNSNDDDDDDSNSNSSNNNDDDDDNDNSNPGNSNDDDDYDDSNDNSSPGNSNDDDDSDPGNSNDDDSDDDSGNSNDDDDDSNENDD